MQRLSTPVSLPSCSTTRVSQILREGGKTATNLLAKKFVVAMPTPPHRKHRKHLRPYLLIPPVPRRKLWRLARLVRLARFVQLRDARKTGERGEGRRREEEGEERHDGREAEVHKILIANDVDGDADVVPVLLVVRPDSCAFELGRDKD